MKTTLLFLPLALLAACASSTPPAQSDAAAPAPADKRVADAVTTPLSDLNLVRAKIPPALAAARRDPYLSPTDPSCANLQAEVLALNEALGPDLDAPQSSSDPSLIERGGDAAGNAAVGAIRGAAEDVVPFRGWIRKLTGAERHSREVAASIAAGGVRRAYLKGLAQARSCDAPPAPLRARP